MSGCGHRADAGTEASYFGEACVRFGEAAQVPQAVNGATEAQGPAPSRA